MNGKCFEKCPSPYVGNLTTHICECPTDFFLSGTGECVPCIEKCKKCTKDPNQCEVCEEKFVLHRFRCLEVCPSNTFTNYLTQECEGTRYIFIK